MRARKRKVTLLLLLSLVFGIGLQTGWLGVLAQNAEEKPKAPACTSPASNTDEISPACLDKDAINLCYFSLNSVTEFPFTKNMIERLEMQLPKRRKINVIEFQPKGENAQAAFERMVKSGVRCHGLVLSGHHTGSWGGQRSTGGLRLDDIENASCDPGNKEFFTNLRSVWLQGCRTLGHEQARADGADLVEFNSERVAQVLEIDGLTELNQWRLQENYSLIYDRENPYSSRLNRAFPNSFIYGWTVSAPSDGAGSALSLFYHMGNVAKLLSREQNWKEGEISVFSENASISQSTAIQMMRAFDNLLGVSTPCAKCLTEGWRLHGNKSRNPGFFGFDNPDLTSLAPITQLASPKLVRARAVDCAIRRRDSFESFDKAVDEALGSMDALSFSLHSIVEKMQFRPENITSAEFEGIRKKIHESENLRKLLFLKLTSPNIGLPRKLDYYKVYRELIGERAVDIEKFIRDAAFRQVLKQTPPGLSAEDAMNFKLQVLSSLEYAQLFETNDFQALLKNAKHPIVYGTLLRFLTMRSNLLVDLKISLESLMASPVYGPQHDPTLLQLVNSALRGHSSRGLKEDAADLERLALNLIDRMVAGNATLPTFTLFETLSLLGPGGGERDSLTMKIVLRAKASVRGTRELLDLAFSVEDAFRPRQPELFDKLATAIFADFRPSREDAQQFLPSIVDFRQYIHGEIPAFESVAEQAIARLDANSAGQFSLILYAVEHASITDAERTELLKRYIDRVKAMGTAFRNGHMIVADLIAQLRVKRDTPSARGGRGYTDRGQWAYPWATAVMKHAVESFPASVHVVLSALRIAQQNPSDPNARWLLETAFSRLQNNTLQDRDDSVIWWTYIALLEFASHPALPLGVTENTLGALIDYGAKRFAVRRPPPFYGLRYDESGNNPIEEITSSVTGCPADVASGVFCDPIRNYVNLSDAQYLSILQKLIRGFTWHAAYVSIPGNFLSRTATFLTDARVPLAVLDFYANHLSYIGKFESYTFLRHIFRLDLTEAEFAKIAARLPGLAEKSPGFRQFLYQYRDIVATAIGEENYVALVKPYVLSAQMDLTVFGAMCSTGQRSNQDCDKAAERLVVANQSETVSDTEGVFASVARSNLSLEQKLRHLDVVFKSGDVNTLTAALGFLKYEGKDLPHAGAILDRYAPKVRLNLETERGVRESIRVARTDAEAKTLIAAIDRGMRGARTAQERLDWSYLFLDLMDPREGPVSAQVVEESIRLLFNATTQTNDLKMASNFLSPTLRLMLHPTMPVESSETRQKQVQQIIQHFQGAWFSSVAHETNNRQYDDLPFFIEALANPRLRHAANRDFLERALAHSRKIGHRRNTNLSIYLAVAIVNHRSAIPQADAYVREIIFSGFARPSASSDESFTDMQFISQTVHAIRERHPEFDLGDIVRAIAERARTPQELRNSYNLNGLSALLANFGGPETWTFVLSQLKAELAQSPTSRGRVLELLLHSKLPAHLVEPLLKAEIDKAVVGDGYVAQSSIDLLLREIIWNLDRFPGLADDVKRWTAKPSSDSLGRAIALAIVLPTSKVEPRLKAPWLAEVEAQLRRKPGMIARALGDQFYMTAPTSMASYARFSAGIERMLMRALEAPSNSSAEFESAMKLARMSYFDEKSAERIRDAWTKRYSR